MLKLFELNTCMAKFVKMAAFEMNKEGNSRYKNKPFLYSSHAWRAPQYFRVNFLAHFEIFLNKLVNPPSIL